MTTTLTAVWTTLTIGQFEEGVRGDRAAFVDGLTTAFFTAGDGDELVSDAMHDYTVQIANFASAKGTLDCIGAFGRTDFREDVAKIDVPTLVIHGDSEPSNRLRSVASAVPS